MMNDKKDLLVDFILPVLIFAVLAGLLFTGKDGEVKTMMTAMIAWVTHSAVVAKRNKKK